MSDTNDLIVSYSIYFIFESDLNTNVINILNFNEVPIELMNMHYLLRLKITFYILRSFFKNNAFENHSGR